MLTKTWLGVLITNSCTSLDFIPSTILRGTFETFRLQQPHSFTPLKFWQSHQKGDTFLLSRCCWRFYIVLHSSASAVGCATHSGTCATHGGTQERLCYTWGHSEELCYTQKRHLRGLRKPIGSRNNRTTLLFQDDDDNDDNFFDDNDDDNDMIHNWQCKSN